MPSIRYTWEASNGPRALELVHVRGTAGTPYPFGVPSNARPTEVPDFWMAAVPVTQALWEHVLGAGSNPALHHGPDFPLENVSWASLTGPTGLLDRLNVGPIRFLVAARAAAPDAVFRLPSETEWEYAARGGPSWRDGYRYSGGNDIDAVAWYDRRQGDHTHPVAQKAPNQLGLYDMSGNVWEWCADVFTHEVARIPADGTPYHGPGGERVLRGGCFHNWAEHCTVFKRYEMASGFHDGCIGCRLVFARPRRAA